MASQFKQYVPVDIWKRLQVIFEGSKDEYPEIGLANLTGESLMNCLTYLMNYTRDCNTVFLIPGTRRRVYLPSPHEAIRTLMDGQVVGVMWLHLPVLPVLGFFVDDPHNMSISFSRHGWTPVSAIALFDLLHQITLLAPEVEIYLSGTCFTDKEFKLFDSVWAQYRTLVG